MPVPSTLKERLRASLSRRGTALALALSIELLLVLMLFFMLPPAPGKEKAPIPTIFGIPAPESDSSKAEKTPEKAAARKAESGEARPVPPRPVEPPPVPPVPLPDNFLVLTRPEYRSADIARMGKAPSAPVRGESAEAGRASGSQPGDTAVVGKAPNGEPLYAAEWYRRPTDAEVGPYISKRARGPGWGVIACRMIAGYRVEDCQELDERPRGSGYAGSVRQASWQFRVRPPRVGGAEKFGTWVQIRITYGQVEGE